LARRIQAFALQQESKLDEAISIARGVLLNDPANLDFNRMLGSFLYQSGKSEEASAHYRGLIEKFPDNLELERLARSGLSTIYVDLGDFAKGEAELSTLLQKDPDDAGVNNDLGYLYADRGINLEKAEEMIRKAIANSEEEQTPSAYLDSLGWVLFKRG